MKRITKAAWNRVVEKACDIANAVMADDEVLREVHTAGMHEILDELEAEFGVLPETLDTRADYLEDPVERRRIYLRALGLARRLGDGDGVEVILESLKNLEWELGADGDGAVRDGG